MRNSLKVKHYFLQDINPVIRFLIISDTVVTGSAGLLGPIFALFISEFIIGGNEAVAGLAAGIFLFSRSILQIPAAYVIDKICGENDDFLFVFIFSLLIAVTPLFYLVIHTPLQLYIIQFVLGIMSAFTYPSYMAIFSRHTDKGKEGTEWGIYFALTDITTAIFSMLGGYLAVSIGFHPLIIAVVILSFLGTLLLWPIKEHMRKTC